MAQQITAQDLRAAGLSRSFADHVIAGTRQIGIPLALWLLEHDGIKVAPLDGMTARQIETLRSVHKPSAPTSVLLRRAANDTVAEARAA